jgi:polyphosphate kinase
VYLIGSADLMPRNLDRRVEVLVRVDDKELQAELQEILDVSLADDHLSWELDSAGVWSRTQRPQGLDSQQWFQRAASGSVAG